VRAYSLRQADGRASAPLDKKSSWGCGGGTLATRLARLGKRLTIVDNNPISFVIAHKFFGLPDDLPCMVSDFRKFIYDDDALYDGIAIDVGGPGFQFNDEFDTETCDAVRARLAPAAHRDECDLS